MPKKQGDRFVVNLNYKVIITKEAYSDLRNCISYLINVKCNQQAAENLLNDYDETVERLKTAAGSLKMCESPNMKARKLHRINFLHHNYFMLYLLEGQEVYVTNVFHALEDAENKLC